MVLGVHQQLILGKVCVEIQKSKNAEHWIFTCLRSSDTLQ